MAKIYGLFGTMTGKLADTVMSVRNGEQIARKYQPIVFNPSSPAQVAQRAKMKLLSQLSASFADIIAFRREGAVSPRNIFTKKNIRKATYADNQADFPLSLLDVTGGVLECSAALSVADTDVSARIFISPDINRVVYAFYSVENKNLRLVSSGVQSVSNVLYVDITLEGAATSSIFLVAYGIRENSDAARAVFENMEAEVTTPAATLDVVRTMKASDFTLTATATAQLAGNRDVEPDPEKKVKKSK